MDETSKEIDDLIVALQGIDQFGGNSNIRKIETDEPIATAGSSAKRSTQILANVRTSGGPISRQIASQNVCDLFEILSEPYRGWSGHRNGRLVGIGASVEATLKGIRRPLGNLGPTWTVVRFVATAVAAFWVVAGEIRFAAILIMVRIVISALQPTSGMSSDAMASVTHGDKRLADSDWSLDWRACVIGQSSDGLIMVSVSLQLASAGRTLWASLVGLTAVFELSSTLLRVAAIQGGLVLRRLHLERVLRNGALLVGLIFSAVIQPAVPAGGVPLIALTATGGLIFGIGEVSRVLISSEAARRVDAKSSLEEMVWRRMANLFPLVERGASADRASIESPRLWTQEDDRKTA